MYEELVKRLRTAQTLAEFVAEETAKMPNTIFGEAADALEELQKQVEDYECRLEISPEAEYAIDKHCDDIISRMDKLIKGLDNKPRWIPVTEKLPEEDEEVLVVAVNDFNKDDRWAAIDWLYCGTWQQHEIVTHWMPLPAPPKEET